MSRILAIGDLHGCLNKLEKMMVLLDWRPEQDTLVFMGDYIDRGPDSAGVVDYILGLKQRSDKVVCLMGNHEQLLLDYMNGRGTDAFLFNGGHATLNSYERSGNRKLESHMPFFPVPGAIP